MRKLSNSEFEILQLFFERDCKIASNEIYDLIEELFPIEWSRQSGSVYLDRMKKKGIIRRERIEGKNYYLAVSQEEYEDFLIRELNKDPAYKKLENMLLHFLMRETIDANKALEEIQEVLRKYRKND